MAKAWDVPGLRGDARFGEAAGRVILTRWREMMSYRDGTLAGEDIEELHAMRVSSRRLRAAMDAFADAFPKRSFRRNLRAVKDITDTLGAARDLDVAVESLQSIRESFTPREQVGIDALIADYGRRRVHEAGRIAELFTAMDAGKFPRRFERWVVRHTGLRDERFDPRPPEAS